MLSIAPQRKTENTPQLSVRPGAVKLIEFKLVDVLAHHFKHVQSSDEKIPASRPGLPIALALGFDELGEAMDLRNLYYVIRDAVRFVHRKAGSIHPKLP